ARHPNPPSPLRFVASKPAAFEGGRSRAVDAAKPGETLWDAEVKGLGLRVWKSGARSYLLKYRRGPIQRMLTIGLHGSPWTPEAARREAKRLLVLIEDGADPAQDRKKNREAATLEAFARRYVEDYAKPFKKASTAAEDERNLRLHVLPALGKMLVKDIGTADVARLVTRMKGKPIAANRVRALLSHMMKQARIWGERDDVVNPVTDVEKFSEAKRERFLSPDELAKLGKVLGEAAEAGENPYVIGALRLLLLTGARLSEILTLKWEWVDFDARLLRLPDSKTGKKTVALSAPALDVLASLPRQEGNPFVICGAVTGARLVNLQKPWRRIRKAAGLDDVRIHDLRHSFASVAVAGGASLPLIGALLGHSQPQTTARYAHLGNDPRLAAADAVATRIAAAMQGGSAEIVPMQSNKV
ncbi:MAG: tyrosine-type recombinase/integrase, partial [Parvularculaceae bacterium]|nr:tyrosine-type recombinase/integrase [Parvularculaceae bacterium]